MRYVLLLAMLLGSSTSHAGESEQNEPTGPEPGTPEEAPEAVSPASMEAPSSTDDASESEEGDGWTPKFVERPSVIYPRGAMADGIEGTVVLRFLLGADGRIVRRADPECRWASLTRQERRAASFDSWWCVEATGGPRALVRATLEAYATARFEPFTTKDGTPSPRYFELKTTYNMARK